MKAGVNNEFVQSNDLAEKNFLAIRLENTGMGKRSLLFWGVFCLFVCFSLATSPCELGHLSSQSFQGSAAATQQAATVQPSSRTHAPGLRTAPARPITWPVLRAERVKSHRSRAPGRALLSGSLQPNGTRGGLLFLGPGLTQGRRAELPGSLPQGPSQARAQNRVFQLTMKL